VNAGVLTLALSLAWAGVAWAGPGCSGPPPSPDASNALVLSGGGAKGAWEAGVAAALIRGDFLKTAPNATLEGDSYFGYTEFLFTF
jgi:hypothetical protein